MSSDAPPKSKLPILWMISLAAWVFFFLCGAAGFLSFHIGDDSIKHDPEVKKINEEYRSNSSYNYYGSKSSGKYVSYFDVLDARKKAEGRLSPPLSVRLWGTVASFVIAGLILMLEVILFAFTLAKSGIQPNYRAYVGGMIMQLIGVVGLIIGIATLAIARPGDVYDHPEVRKARDAEYSSSGYYNKSEEERRKIRQNSDETYERIKDSKKPLLYTLVGIIGLSFVLTVRGGFGVVISFCILLYKLWKTVQDGRARTSAGQAVGFCFIPFYNLYWMFVALPGLADELNRCAQNRSLQVAPASKGLFMAYCIMVFAACIPFLGIIASVVNCFIAIAAFRSASRVAIALQEKSLETQPV